MESNKLWRTESPNCANYFNEKGSSYSSLSPDLCRADKKPRIMKYNQNHFCKVFNLYISMFLSNIVSEKEVISEDSEARYLLMYLQTSILQKKIWLVWSASIEVRPTMYYKLGQATRPSFSSLLSVFEIRRSTFLSSVNLPSPRL